MTNEEKAKEIIKISCTKQVYDIVDLKSLEEALYDDLMDMAEWKDAQRRTPSDETTEGFVHLVIGEVACHETEVERQIEQGKAFAECNKTVFEVAMAVAQFFDTQLQMKMDAIKELTERNAALKRQLAESNKQIVIYAKKVRNLEADPEESV